MVFVAKRASIPTKSIELAAVFNVSSLATLEGSNAPLRIVIVESAMLASLDRETMPAHVCSCPPPRQVMNESCYRKGFELWI